VIALFGLLLPLRLYSLPEPERIEVPVAPAFGPYRRFFPREAVRHPAKANLHLIERLIELASSPGDLVLDPFAGTFSTCVVSVLMGREAVGVEIEQEYLGWGLEASRRVQEEIGRAFHVLWADASTIGNLLRPSSVNAVVTSPPYVLVSLHAGDPERRLERVLRAGGDPRDFFGGMARNALRERSHRHDYYSLNRWVALIRDVLSGLREALKGGSLAAFIVRNRIRRGSLLELDSILASLALEFGFKVEALYSAPAPKSLWANLLAKKGLRLPSEDRVVVLRR
jgi:DNA modification methylase